MGGLLFNIFINDIDKAVISALLRKFADDTKMAMEIGGIDDAKKMQETLNNLCCWAAKWRMGFNEKKYKVMHYAKHNTLFFL